MPVTLSVLLRDYAELTKLRVTSLIVLTAWTGFYFAVTTEGEVGPGDAIEPIERADEGLTVADVVRLYTVDAKNQELLRRATQTSRLPDGWKDYFRKRLWDPDA